MSSCEAIEPRNLPPLATRRQVAMTIVPGWESRKRLILGSAESRLGEVVQPELKKGVIPNQEFGFFGHLVGIGADDRHTDSWQSQGQKTGRVRGSRIHRCECSGPVRGAY